MLRFAGEGRPPSCRCYDKTGLETFLLVGLTSISSYARIKSRNIGPVLRSY